MIKLKTILGITAIISLIIISMPNTISLFGGQHAWYDLFNEGTDVPCQKCHADIISEMKSGVGPHMNETGFGRMKCAFCHRSVEFSDNTTYATGSGDVSIPGHEAHAASTMDCMDCHGSFVSGMVGPYGGVMPHDIPRTGNGVNEGCMCHNPSGFVYPPHATYEFEREECVICHGHGSPTSETRFTCNYVPGAGGFGLTDDTVNDTGSKAAHLPFVLGAAQTSGLMNSENEACIACHTDAPVGIRFNLTNGYELTVNKTCDWEIGDFVEGNYSEVIV